MKAVVEGFTGHYSTVELDSMADVRQVLAGGADALNWLFLGTSGVHGNHGSLDDLFFEPASDNDPDWDPGYVNDHITVLVVQPRMVRSYYGHVQVAAEDVPWLREQVARTLDAVRASQDGNLPPGVSGD